MQRIGRRRYQTSTADVHSGTRPDGAFTSVPGREPDGSLDLGGLAAREERRFDIVHGSALCVWPPSFRMEAELERPHRLCADMG